ncbi:SRPBCC family protein [Neobacillus niacini]|nr:SRPBCC family protein [Neobacillus niacini]MEC1523813.1 SRPBCC family protein [Neobacillus niacini]
MPLLEHKQFIHAPIEVCFDVARGFGIHPQTPLKGTGKTVGGLTEGLPGEGDCVTWECVNFGIKQRITSRIIFMEKPHSFVEKMVKGPFKTFIYIHQFIEEEKGTTMIDHIQYHLWLGPIGVLMDKWFLAKYFKKIIVTRSIELKEAAEKKTNQTFD